MPKLCKGENRRKYIISVQPLGPAASLAATRAADPNLRGVLAHDFVTPLNASYVCSQPPNW